MRSRAAARVLVECVMNARFCFRPRLSLGHLVFADSALSLLDDHGDEVCRATERRQGQLL